ncbi:MAG: outer membrane beta-barrel protein, partial [Bacteroidales bacterium]|nr:outer membrane beta-barrel protein [Bacteroidales bacterium]
MGFEFNNYFFDGKNSIQKNEMGMIEEVVFNEPVTKSKLTTTFLNVPALLELQLGKGSRTNRLHLSAGAIGGLKIGSHTKVVFQDDKHKEKEPDDFNINPLRLGLTARMGYKNIQVYSNYYLTPFSKKIKDLNYFRSI